eukprot:CAMPEP_0184479336 /NCGR_PEP_ID=MMETSP0113_2-20130426/1100_1 /TAXON_ID=91329 /ORGANISM="Norrisiella sphaerica, Strain BC52" /LENGTH=317 /DNA_ID=CAMNT_0026857395 /DNA_START=294 /DNA_END=1247 /DNA_ORIENTATION=+
MKILRNFILDTYEEVSGEPKMDAKAAELKSKILTDPKFATWLRSGDLNVPNQKLEVMEYLVSHLEGCGAEDCVPNNFIMTLLFCTLMESTKEKGEENKVAVPRPTEDSKLSAPIIVKTEDTEIKENGILHVNWRLLDSATGVVLVVDYSRHQDQAYLKKMLEMWRFVLGRMQNREGVVSRVLLAHLNSSRRLALQESKQTPNDPHKEKSPIAAVEDATPELKNHSDLVLEASSTDKAQGGAPNAATTDESLKHSSEGKRENNGENIMLYKEKFEKISQFYKMKSESCHLVDLSGDGGEISKTPKEILDLMFPALLNT